MQSTKRTLLTNVTALLLCFIMLVGTTFAWFTDIATSNGNVIQSGTLDITLAKGTKTDEGWTWSDTDGQAIFNYEKWEPGYTTTAVLAVENHGTLSAKWTAKLELDGTPTILADVIDIYVTSYHNYSTDRPDFNDGTWQKLGTVRDVLDNNGLLLPGETIDPGHRQPILVAIKMRENAGNDYQNMDLGANFNITILATQASVESDSYDNTYDADAEWPTLDNGYSASAPIDSANLILGALTSEMQIGGNGIGATIPADVKVADGATSLDLAMKKVDNGNLDFVGATNATSFDVHIEGIADDNTQPMIVNLGAVLPKGLTDTELKLYHTENGTPVEMTRVDSVADFAIHNQYTYDPTTGEVSIYVASFSVFTAVNIYADLWDGKSAATAFASGTGTEADPYLIDSAAQLVYFRNQVDGGNTFAGKYVKLGRDINLAGFNFDPIGRGYESSGGKVFKGTFDGQNYTIYGLKQNGWELGFDNGTQGAGLFASVVDATIKNLTISGADIKFDCVDMGIVVGYAYGTCNFENIIVTKSTIANYNRYTGGVVGEVNGTHTFKDIIVDSSVVISSLWGSFDTSIGGVIGGKYGNATVKMENVIVAAELDVYSDVTAAYQWYAYRRCGMLIGHTEQNSPKSALNADAPFLTCENVNVFYGDWVNYNYYEFAKQDSDTGKRYPWVRAEASPVGNNGAFSNPRYGVPAHDGVTVTDANKDQYKTGYAAITFNQLYGGGQGVYGKADHDGVKTHHLPFNATTIYFQNSKGWENLKLQYIYKVGENTYTTVVEGISLGDAVDTIGVYPIYKVTVPSDAYAFTISDGTYTTPEIKLSGLVENDLYYVSGSTVKHRGYTGQYKTVYFQNNWKWTDVRLYYWYSDGSYDIAWEGAEMTYDHNDGQYNHYKFAVPTNVAGFNINGKKNDGSGDREETPTIQVSNVSENYYYYMVTNKTAVGLSPKIVYFTPSEAWKQANARFAAYFFNNSTNAKKWVDMIDADGDGVYECAVPQGVWEAMIFCRMNPNYSTNSWDTTTINYVWEQTYDITIPSDGKNSFTVNNVNKLYLKPNSNWTQSNARFAAYFFGNGEKWVSMTDTDNDGIYECEIPSGYTKVIFCRMNGSASANNWNNKWNQTGDLTFTVGGNNLFTVPSGAWDGSTSGWSAGGSGKVNGTWSKK